MAEPPPNQQVPVNPRARIYTAKVWQHFDREDVEVDGVSVVRATCKWHGCSKQFIVPTGQGIGHLRRHYESHVKRERMEADYAARLAMGNMVIGNEN